MKQRGDLFHLSCAELRDLPVGSRLVVAVGPWDFRKLSATHWCDAGGLRWTNSELCAYYVRLLVVPVSLDEAERLLKSGEAQ